MFNTSIFKNLTPKFSRYAEVASRFFITQLCVTLISWPLMLEWGLPVSVLSPIGNAIFNPFVILFLALSALITGAEIIQIPHGLLDIGLEQITSVWISIIKIAPPGLVLTLQKPPLILSLCAPIGTILIMHTRAIRGMWRKLLALVLLFISLTAIFALMPPVAKISVPYGSRAITIHHNNDSSLVAFDPGFSRRAAGIDTWITFTLLPQLSINFGRQQIDRYVCKKLTPAVAQLLKLLCEKEIVRTLYLPPPSEKKESKQYKKMRDELVAIAHQYKTTVR